MKYLTALLLSSAVLFFECDKNQKFDSAQNSGSVQNVNASLVNTMNSETIAGIEYAVKFENATKDSVDISYTVQNKSDKSYLIFNRGDTNKGLRAETVYAEPNGAAVEFSQKRFKKPADKNCPRTEVPVEAGASWLKPGQTRSETVRVVLPPQVFTPFDDCTPQPEMPKQVKRARFCLGVAEADPKNVIVNENGYVENLQNVGEQKLLCSEETVL